MCVCVCVCLSVCEEVLHVLAGRHPESVESIPGQKQIPGSARDLLLAMAARDARQAAQTAKATLKSFPGMGSFGIHISACAHALCSQLSFRASQSHRLEAILKKLPLGLLGPLPDKCQVEQKSLGSSCGGLWQSFLQAFPKWPWNRKWEAMGPSCDLHTVYMRRRWQK